MTAIAAGSNIKKLEEQMREFHPLLVCVFQKDAAKELRDRTKDLNIRVVSGMDGLLEGAVQPESCLLYTSRFAGCAADAGTAGCPDCQHAYDF